MNIVDPTRSLIEFNRRVLTQGSSSNINAVNEVNVLNNLMFFNSVFSSNTDEMFQKFDMTTMSDEYLELCSQRNMNIAAIIQRFCMIEQGIVISNTPCFEERMMVEKYRDLIEIKGYKFPADPSSYEFIHGVIYHLLINDEQLLVGCAYPEASIYERPLGTEISGKMFYWKTDTVLRHYLESVYGTSSVTIRATRNQKTGKISKVEYDGDRQLMSKLRVCFPADALVVSNPFLYTKDIESIIKSRVTEKEVEIPNFNPPTFNDIFNRDILVEYPRNSFNEYLHILKMAANCPSVSDIYLTLYRIGTDPAIFYILRHAVQNGIKVHVNIELLASGEKINSSWYREMKAVGIDVTTYPYHVSKTWDGRNTCKVHCKLTLIKFVDGKMIAQIGTGNYHTKTTAQYTDLSYITSSKSICSQVQKVFKILKGDEDQKFDKDVLVSKYNARDTLIELINNERRKGVHGYIAFKCNAIDDPEIISHLDRAARAGCKMHLVVRGVCTWIPNEINKSVIIKSIVWDKLEHSRVYAFGTKNPTVYIGSMDLVKHKMNHRIETLVRLDDPDIVVQVVEYLNRYIVNTNNSWIQTELGIYRKEWA